MVGQKNLLSKIHSYTIDTFPHSSLLIGETGCGKHTLVQEIANDVLNIPFVDITSCLSWEVIDNIYKSVNPTIYIIDLSKITENQQNAALKFVEEPCASAFVILLAEDTNLILNTILNRCIIFTFEAYTKEELSQFVPEGVDSKLLLDMVTSPGKLKSCNPQILDATIEYANRIATRIGEASYPNMLSISSKINYKDEYDKFDFEILLRSLDNALLSHYLEDRDVKYYKLHECFGKHRRALRDKRLNKECWMESTLTDLWLCAQGG